MRKRNTDSSNRYEIIQNDNQSFFSFITENGTAYYADFQDQSQLLIKHQGLFGFYEFSFEHIDNQSNSRQKFDTKIRNTIEDLLFQFFESPDKVLYYVCDSSDNRQLARQRLFKRWFGELEPLPINQLEIDLSDELKVIILIHQFFPFQQQFEEALFESEIFYSSQK
jgi:hypothetical protein